MTRRKVFYMFAVIATLVAVSSFFSYRYFEPIISTTALHGTCSQPGSPQQQIQAYRGLFHRNYFFVTSSISGSYFISFEEKIVGKAGAGYHDDWLIPCFDNTGFYTWLETPLAEFKFSEPWIVQFSGDSVRFDSKSLSCEIKRIGS